MVVVAEFTGVYAGYTCQELAHNYQNAFDAACKCAADFDWDAVVANMVYVWTGLAQSMGLKGEIRSVENPRKEAEAHYYKPEHTGLLDLGLKPHYLTDDALAAMIEFIA